MKIFLCSKIAQLKIVYIKNFNKIKRDIRELLIMLDGKLRIIRGRRISKLYSSCLVGPKKDKSDIFYIYIYYS